jgi:hypothetical protein
MERTAKMMQEDMPLTFQDMQRTSKEFEILGKQLNYLAGVVVSTVGGKWAGRLVGQGEQARQAGRQTFIGAQPLLPSLVPPMLACALLACALLPGLCLAGQACARAC